jgi:hypothetical protein
MQCSLTVTLPVGYKKAAGKYSSLCITKAKPLGKTNNGFDQELYTMETDGNLQLGYR